MALSVHFCRCFCLLLILGLSSSAPTVLPPSQSNRYIKTSLRLMLVPTYVCVGHGSRDAYTVYLFSPALYCGTTFCLFSRVLEGYATFRWGPLHTFHTLENCIYTYVFVTEGTRLCLLSQCNQLDNARHLVINTTDIS